MRNAVGAAVLGLILAFSPHSPVAAQADTTAACSVVAISPQTHSSQAIELPVNEHNFDPYCSDDVRAYCTCKYLIVTVRETLLTDPPDLRDEAYTTILWLRMDAEEFFSEGTYDACIEAMITVKQIAGLD
jgi:hypothetical protein